ncbi:hypothetical protein H4Q32_008807 [Labeo rohita]|uniref:Core-binding (CB) domain-containing protein n=1 Tax=Labeo rohita TaxID=84645 RepID=A0ABQ8M3J5_LABRO|nr:hypothetical protein H4Q32_008807 [Labeo rohita]
MGVAPEGAHLVASGAAEVVETILQSRAPSTRKLYTLWRLFTSWCIDHQQDPVNCPVGTVLEYLQDRFSAGLAHSTLRVYIAAISAYHAPLGGMSVGKDPLVVCFLRGALRLRSPVQPRVPTWDLAMVLEALCRPPFEPIEEPFVLLPFGIRTGRSLTVCVQFEGWTRTSTELPCGERLTGCSSAMVPLRGASLLPSKPLAAGLWMRSLKLMSPQAFPLSWGLKPTLFEASLPPRPSCRVSLCRTCVTLRDAHTLGRDLELWGRGHPPMTSRFSIGLITRDSEHAYTEGVPHSVSTQRLAHFGEPALQSYSRSCTFFEALSSVMALTFSESAWTLFLWST